MQHSSMMNELINRIMDTIGGLILISLFVILFLLETLSPLRIRKQKRTQRIFINAVFAIVGFVSLRLILLPAMVWIALKNEEWKIGLNYLYESPLVVKSILAFLLLDYTNYLWHILNHKIPLLWRFHLVHHTDLDLDVTTAIRFHAGEMIASVFYRSLAVLLLGVSPWMVLVYEICFEAATQFHHSNWKLPFAFEKILNFIVVTPRMHGMHHSIIKNETDSNFSVIFSVWDRLHKTRTPSILNKDLIIGVSEYQNAKELTVDKLLALPFTKIKKTKA